MTERFDLTNRPRVSEAMRGAAEWMRNLTPDQREEIQSIIQKVREARPNIRDLVGQEYLTCVFVPKGLHVQGKKSRRYTQEYIKKQETELEERRKTYHDGLSVEEIRDNEDGKEFATFMEALLTEKARELFPGATPHPVSEPTDELQGIDLIVTLPSKDPKLPFGHIVAFDVTYGEEEIDAAAKLTGSVVGLKRGKLTNPQGLKIGDTYVNAQVIPKVTIPLSRETIQRYVELWAGGRNAELFQDGTKRALYELIDKQLAMQLNVASTVPTDSFTLPTHIQNKSEKVKNENRVAMRTAMQASLRSAREYIHSLLTLPEMKDVEPRPDKAIQAFDTFLDDPRAAEELIALADEKIKKQNREATHQDVETEPKQETQEADVRRIEQLQETLQNPISHETVPTGEVIRNQNRLGPIEGLSSDSFGIPHVTHATEHRTTHIPHIAHSAGHDAHGHASQSFLQKIAGGIGGSIGAVLETLWKNKKDIALLAPQFLNYVFGPTVKNVWDGLKKAVGAKGGSVHGSHNTHKPSAGAHGAH